MCGGGGGGGVCGGGLSKKEAERERVEQDKPKGERGPARS